MTNPPPMTDDLVERLRKGRLIQKGEEITVIVDGVARKAGTGEIREMAHPDALEAAARIEALEAENGKLRDAQKVMRDGYADAASGLRYVLQEHGRLFGVGFDRVEDHFFEWVTMREREGLLAGSSTLTPEVPHAD